MNHDFSLLFNTDLGSPFLTTYDPPDIPPDLELVDGTPVVVPRAFTVTRPPSPTFSDTFSIISPDVPTDVSFSSPTKLSILSRSFSSPLPALLTSNSTQQPLYSERCTPHRQCKYLIPRLWDILSSPARHSRPRSPRFISPLSKGKARATDIGISALNLDDLDPLDGEEGELIEDEACFVDITVVTGIDILALLPNELSLYIMSNFLDLPSIMACLAVSHKWRALASDNSIWRGLFAAEESCGGRGWSINLRRIQDLPLKFKQYYPSRRPSHPYAKHRRHTTFSESSKLSRQHIYRPARSPGIVSRHGPRSAASMSSTRLPHLTSLTRSPLMLDWQMLYKERLELDRRWLEAEPKVKRLEGHTDSVYCLEFDSTRIISGSRDRSIKAWSLATGRLLGTFQGHSGSVLCLKFDKDWEMDAEGSSARKARKCVQRRVMISGSSDCTVRVWDLWEEYPAHERKKSEEGDGTVCMKAQVRTVLEGHTGGVLDLRLDERWIVSCSKDSLICIWDRRTLRLHRKLHGHEGPVNAIGLQSYGDAGCRASCGGRVVSASGDGKLMVWDIESGARLRVLEGHDRGLACVEFKDDIIVSGSSDRKVMVWSASTGECLRTLVGHDALVRALSFDPKSGWLVTGSYDKTVKLWDLRKGELVREFRNVHTSHIFDVKFDVGRIVSSSHDRTVIVLDFTKDIDPLLFL